MDPDDDDDKDTRSVRERHYCELLAEGMQAATRGELEGWKKQRPEDDLELLTAQDWVTLRQRERQVLGEHVG
jgi:hypothetical protein